MSLTLPYPTMSGSLAPTGAATIDQFTSVTVHGDAVHNNPHAKLLANDTAIKSAVDTLEAEVIALGVVPAVRIETVYVGTLVNYADTVYTYSRAYVPLFLTFNVRCLAAGSASVIAYAQWRNISNGVIQAAIRICDEHGDGGPDGGANLNASYLCTLPFFVGTKYIYLTSNSPSRILWNIIGITEQISTRPASWGY